MTVTHTYENGKLHSVTIQSGDYRRTFTDDQWNNLVWLGDYLGCPLLVDKMPAIDDFKRLVTTHERTYSK